MRLEAADFEKDAMKETLAPGLLADGHRQTPRATELGGAGELLVLLVGLWWEQDPDRVDA